MTLPPHNAPEPDVAVTDAPRGEGYMPAASLALVVEISDTSIRFDLSEKKAIYAAARIPEYWVADLQDGMLHQFWAPAEGLYTQGRVVALGGALASVTVAGLVIDGAGLL